MPDLKKAALQLPSSYASNDIGRVTKWAAEGILAKAYMTRHETNDLDSALVLINDIIANSPNGLITTGILVAGTQLSAYSSIFDISNEMNKEIIFAIRFKGGTSGLGSPFWSNFAPDGSGSKFLAVGTPGGNNNATTDLLNVFKSDTTAGIKNIRYHQSILMYGKKTTSLIGAPYKWVDPTIQQVNQGENDWIVLRFADVLLLRAEINAQREVGDLGLSDVNTIRARAGVTLYTSATYGTGTGALDKVYLERRLELAFEDTRWFDLLRMNQSYGYPDKAVSILKNEVFVTDISLYSGYKPIIPPSQEYYKSTKLLLPIPQQEIDTYNSGNTLTLTQNADY